MELIDEEGNLFGVVNVIDVLVILFVVAVVVAGAALVLNTEDDDPDPGPTLDETYATLDLGTQPSYIVGDINEGDTVDLTATSSMTITDVHLAPTDDGADAIVRVRIEGETDDDGTIQYDDAPLRLGRTLSVMTDRYNTEGTIRAVGDGDSLETKPVTVVLHDRMPASTASAVTPGDEIRVGDRTVATIEDRHVYSTKNPNTRSVYVEATLITHAERKEPRFGPTKVLPKQTITLDGDGYQLDGTIAQIGSLADLGEPETRTVHLRMEGVHESFADGIRPGMNDRSGDTTLATVTAVDVEPSIVLFEGDNAEIGVYDHPFERNVRITADMQILDSPSGLRFKGESIRQGETVTLDLGTVTITATVSWIE